MSRARSRPAPRSAKTTSAYRSRRIDGAAGASHPGHGLPMGRHRMLRRAGVVAAALAGLMLGGVTTQAQDYPSRPIRLLIHTPPGSLVDVLGRLIGQELSARLGQSFVADNRTGGATMIAVEQLLHSPADGYTLMISTSEATMQPFLKKAYRYDPIKDFTPVALLVTSWTVFAVNPKVPASTLKELVTYSKQ